MADENYRADSYRYATAPALSDDNKTADGLAKSRRILTAFKPKKKQLESDDLKEEINFDHHKINLEDLYYRFGTHPLVGLTHAKATENLERDGPNMITSLYRVPEWVKFLKQLFGGFTIFLWSAVLICFITYSVHASTQVNPSSDELVFGFVLLFVILLSGTFSYFQERKSSRILESFKTLVPHYATVIRQGEKMNILVEDIVLGDVVEVMEGDRIPADLRLIEVRGFKVNNSALTGESQPQNRGIEMTHDNPLETRNLAFYSTYAVEGSAKGVVIACGYHTVLGKIAGLTESLPRKPAPLSNELYFFMSIISSVTIAMGIFFFIITLMLGYFWVDSIVFLIGFVVANIPEGLLVTITICLSISAKRMASKNCLVKNIEALETLGLTSIICTDKTGTLTQNRMTVAHMWFDNQIIETGITKDEEFLFDISSPGFKSLARVAALCSRADFVKNQEDVPVLQRKVTGDASEAALLKFVEMTVGGIVSYRKKHKKIFEIPFNPTNKFQLSIHETQNSKEYPFLVVMKGAPEIVIGHCSSMLVNGVEKAIDDKIRGDFHNAYIKLGSMGERVFGFCELNLPASKYPIGTAFDLDRHNVPLNGFRFVGLISMIDPPRTSVPDAVMKCRSAGIKIIMITGDSPATAKAVAKSVGIISEGNETVEDIARKKNVPVAEIDPREARAVVVHGNDLREMHSRDLDEIIESHSEVIFARMTPQQKLAIVESCQRIGGVVAVTGDGVNDAPALKVADVGIAMGITGSDMSKETADVILLDDNFATIVAGIEEGRLIFDNLKKSIFYTLTSNIPEVFPFFAFIVLNIPLPLGTFAILCIDLGTDLFPAISLSYEAPESNDTMKKQPLNPNAERLINDKLLSMSLGQIGMIQAAAGFFAYFVVMAQNGFKPAFLLGLRQEWNSRAVNDLSDAYGQEWTYHSRKGLEYTCHTAFFAAIVVTQWANLIICKTRRNSIYKQGMRNHFLNFSLGFETILALLLIYIPGMGVALRMYPLKFTWWLPGLPFMLVIFIYDEFRKFFIRRYSGGWLENETYY